MSSESRYSVVSPKKADCRCIVSSMFSGGTGGDQLGLPPSDPSTGPINLSTEPNSKLLSSLAAPDTHPGKVPRVSILAAAGDELEMLA